MKKKFRTGVHLPRRYTRHLDQEMSKGFSRTMWILFVVILMVMAVMGFVLSFHLCVM